MLTLVIVLAVLFVLKLVAERVFLYYVLRDAELPSENLMVNIALTLWVVVLFAAVLFFKHGVN